MANNHSHTTGSLGDIVAGLKEIAREHDEISVRAVISEFGDRSFAPFMLILSLIGALPTGAVPGVPTVVAITILTVAAQLAFGREHIWLPAFIADRSVASAKLRGATDKLDWVASKLDSIAKGRLKFLTGSAATRVIGAVIALLCCFIPLLELVPFAAAAPFAAIALLSLALIVRDGLVVLIAGFSAVVAGFGGYFFLAG